MLHAPFKAREAFVFLPAVLRCPSNVHCTLSSLAIFRMALSEASRCHSHRRSLPKIAAKDFEADLIYHLGRLVFCLRKA
jgi:hypothetical protein